MIDLNIRPDDVSEVNPEILMSAKSWHEKTRILMQWSQYIQNKPELRKEQYLLSACEAPAWLYVAPCDDRVEIIFDSDSRIIKGVMVYLIASMLSVDKTVGIFDVDGLKHFFLLAGLNRHLSPSRSNGLNIVVQNIVRAYHGAHGT